MKNKQYVALNDNARDLQGHTPFVFANPEVFVLTPFVDGALGLDRVDQRTSREHDRSDVATNYG